MSYFRKKVKDKMIPTTDLLLLFAILVKYSKYSSMLVPTRFGFNFPTSAWVYEGKVNNYEYCLHEAVDIRGAGGGSEISVIYTDLSKELIDLIMIH